MTYQESIEYLYNRLPVFHHIGAAAYKPGLENSIRLMEQLGNPQHEYKVIHVAGTNGKGSVSHFLSAILQSAGYKTGLFTSPHLVDFGERIRVDGEKINQDYVAGFVENNQKVFDEIQPSFFEATMALAFRYFADCKVDVAVVEVGLGGRLDSTNIVKPELSVITNISFDHTEFLGDTLAKIAAEKAGIIKQHTPVIIGEYLPETKSVFIEKAEIIQAPLIFAEDKYKVEYDDYEQNVMIVNAPGFNELRIGLGGIYQLKNIATVITATEELQKLGFAIYEEDIRTGLKEVVALTNLQGRWQIVQQNPVVVLDTGHNKGGFEYITQQLKRQQCEKMRIVIGMVKDKDITGMLRLLPVKAVYYFTNAKTERALPAENLKEQAEKQGLRGDAFADVQKAVRAALNDASGQDFVYIGGSNFVVGEALPVFTKQ